MILILVRRSTRRYLSDMCPSGDQSEGTRLGDWMPAASWVSSVSTTSSLQPPPALFSYNSVAPFRFVRNRILVPSGDHTDEALSADPEVMRDWLPRVRSVSQMSGFHSWDRPATRPAYRHLGKAENRVTPSGPTEPVELPALSNQVKQPSRRSGSGVRRRALPVLEASAGYAEAS